MDIDAESIFQRLSKAASEGKADLISSILAEQIATSDLLKYRIQKQFPLHITPPLLAACQTGQLEVVRILVTSFRYLCPPDIYYDIFYDETPLSAAAKHGYVDVMKVLLKHYYQVELRESMSHDLGSALVVAAFNGQHEAANLLLNCGVHIDINRRYEVKLNNESRMTPLMAATHTNHVNLVQVLLDSSVGVPPDIEPLVLACKKGHSDIARLLIQHGVEVNGSTPLRETPVTVAVEKGHAGCLRLLLENGVDIAKTINLAITNGHLDQIQLLLECTDINDVSCITALYSGLLRACKEGHMSCFKLLIDCDVWTVNGEAGEILKSNLLFSYPSVYPLGMPPLLAACQGGQVEVVSLLLKYKDIQINFAYELETPLTAAVRGGYVKLVKLLIEHDVDVNFVGDGKQSHSVQSALYIAASNGHYDLALLLLEYGIANVNIGVAFTCDTPIMAAAQNGHTNLVKVLLDIGAEVHSRNPRITPSALTQACKAGHVECAKLLIQRGANVNEDTDEGTPLTCAVENGHAQCTKLLLENGADINGKNSLNYTPLMLASQNDSVEVARILLEHGANINEKSYGDSALTLAIRNYSETTANLLMQHGAIKEHIYVTKWDSEYSLTDDSEVQSGTDSEDEMVDDANELQCEKDSEKEVEILESSFTKEAKLLAVVEKVVQEKGTLEHTLIHGVLAGPARSGKSSLMKRLTGEMPDSTSPSTGVAEQVIQVGVKQSYSIALGVYDSIWFKLLYDEEAIRLITLASYATSPLPPHPHASHALTDSSVNAVTTVPLQSDTEHVIIPPRKEQERIFYTTANAASLFPAGYIAPMGVFKNAIRGKGLEGLREHFENSWSFYLTDTGGQIEFQELLPLLVSGPSIFFLTFCLHQDLNQRFIIEYHLPDGERSEPYQSTLTVMEVILQTLASIASMSTFVYKAPKNETIQIKPKVFIVGTHKDLLDQDKLDTEIQRIDQHIQTAIKSTTHYQEDLVEFASKSQLIFTVNNLSEVDTDFKLIRAAVERVVYRSKFEISFPTNWLIFSLVLRQEMIKDSVISYDQCFAIAKDCGITDHKELNYALQFLHTKIGLVRHFPIPDLHDIVIRNPQILFDMVTKLIVNTFTFENVCHRELTEFEKKGIFTIEDLALIEKFSVPLFPLEKLFKLLEHLRIVAPFQEDGKTKYFIPCVLAHSIESESQSPSLTSDVPPLLITFKCGYCPKGVPGVLIKYLITNEMGSKFEWELMTDQIFKDQVSFCVSPYDTITLKIHPMYLELTHSAMSKLKRNQEVSNVCNNVRLSIEKGIKKVSSDMNLSSHAKHFLTFYCQNSECSQNKPHPATKICRNEDGSFCNLWCKSSGKILQSPLSDGYSVWFGKGRGGHDGIHSSSLSPPHLDDTMTTAECDVKHIERRLQDVAISDTHGQLAHLNSVLTEEKHLEICLYIQSLGEGDIVRLGQSLGLLRSKLKKMKTLPDDMIDAWLNREDNVLVKSGPPTWKSLCVALRKIGQNGIAKDIEFKGQTGSQ